MLTVSVVIPAFNAEGFIGSALESIEQQTLRELEVLIVDDGSTDGTVRECQRFASRLDLRVLRQKNAGPAAARNAGIRAARGRYCAFLDADDRMLPDRLAMQAERLGLELDLGLVHSDLMTFDDEGIIHRTRRAFSSPCGGHILDRLLVDNFITTSTVMAPRQRLIEAGLFGEARRLSEDFELWLRIAERWRIGFIEQPLTQYRRRSDSLSADKLLTARAALEVIESFWGDHPEYRRLNPQVYRDSLASHLSTAGAAALAGNQRGRALVYLLRSLRWAPFFAVPWRNLVKTFVPSVVSRRVKRYWPRTGEPA